MTGPYEGVLGRKKEKVLSALVTGMPTYFDVATHDLRVCGALVTVDSATGRASAIERLVIPVTEAQLAAREAAPAEGPPEPPESGDSLENP
jgi:calcineurin-like phosphoesterase